MYIDFPYNTKLVVIDRVLSPLSYANQVPQSPSFPFELIR